MRWVIGLGLGWLAVVSCVNMCCPRGNNVINVLFHFLWMVLALVGLAGVILGWEI